MAEEEAERERRTMNNHRQGSPACGLDHQHEEHVKSSGEHENQAPKKRRVWGRRRGEGEQRDGGEGGEKVEEG